MNQLHPRRLRALSLGLTGALLAACGAGGGELLDSGTGDTEGPSPGVIADGVATDIDTQVSTTILMANWSGFSDPAGVAGYEWALGRTPGGTEVQPWVDVGDVTSASNANLALDPGTRYYVAVRATDNLGNVGGPAVSDGVLIEGGGLQGGSGSGSGGGSASGSGSGSSSGSGSGSGGGPALASSISRHGITWTFDRNHEVGQFVNGDWWVKGPVEVIAITPQTGNTGGRVMHGSMINPDPSLRDQAYDSTMYAGNAPTFFRSGQNVALEITGLNPLTVAVGSSLISTESHAAAGNLPQLTSAAVLTVLADIPPADAFRPPYAGTDKTIRWREGDLDVSKLANLAAAPGAPNMQTAAGWFDRVWLDHAHGWLGRYMHPSANMPNYGREMSDQIGNAALLLHLDYPLAQKRDLLVRFVQLGIDFYGIAKNGGKWPSDGGHCGGRKFPILFAGELLGDPDFLAATRLPHVRFGEDGQTFFVAQTSPGVYNYGHGGYTAGDVGLPEWGFQHDSSPQRDNRDWNADNYRVCCTANCWVGWVLAARIMNLRGDWNHDALFDYQDRYMVTEAQGSWTRSWSRFPENMWDQYRGQF